jgi:hypothetical protein
LLLREEELPNEPLREDELALLLGEKVRLGVDTLLREELPRL